LAGARAHFTPAEGDVNLEGIVTLLRHICAGMSRLLAVTQAAADLASHISIAGTVSLLEKEQCKHVSKLGTQNHQVDAELVRNPSQTGRVVARILTEDLWVKVGREMMHTVTP
jgi:hypothetical protein